MNLAIVNTRCANLASVRFACERLGITPTITADVSALQAADKVILPGVGNAQAAMRELKRLQLAHVIPQLSQPVLGICLGMQLLSAHSQEADTPCLGIVAAETERMQVHDLTLPHMGWNKLTLRRNHPLVAGLEGAYFYFVHSYALPVADYTLASGHYERAFSAVIQQDNFYGIQCHPERSGAAGARFLQNFIDLSVEGEALA